MIRITQREFNKLRDIDRLLIHSSMIRSCIHAYVSIITGIIAGLFVLHNLFLFNIYSMMFFFIIELGCGFYGLYELNKIYNRVHLQLFDEDGKVKESYLKKYKIKY